MISEIKKLPEKTEEDIAYEELIEEFNKEAINQKSKYRIEIQYNYPFLVKRIFLNIGNSLGSHQIYYHQYLKEFSFINGIDEQTYKEIEPILLKISKLFKIELI